MFSTPGLILEVDQSKQWNPGLGSGARSGRREPSSPRWSCAIIRRPPQSRRTTCATPVRTTSCWAAPPGDTLISSEGDDTLYGDGGNDRMEGGAGNDQYIGGDGDDIITDLFGDDIMRTGRGHDAVNAGQGVDLIVADEGNDFIVLGADSLDEAFGGVGNDFVLGSKTTEQTLGGEGDDWIEVGAWTGAVGDNFDDQFQLDASRGTTCSTATAASTSSSAKAATTSGSAASAVANSTVCLATTGQLTRNEFPSQRRPQSRRFFPASRCSRPMRHSIASPRSRVPRVEFTTTSSAVQT